MPLRAAVAVLVCAGTLGSPTPAKAGPAPSLTDCDTEGVASVLSASPAPAAQAQARAYWLTRQFLKWPDADAAGSFKLYYSGLGQLALADGVVAGADGALALVADGAGAPALAAKRFEYVGDGVILRVAEGDLARLPDLLRGQLLLVQEDRQGTALQSTGIQVPGALDDWYSRAAEVDDLGPGIKANQSSFRVWAPTARSVALCLYGSGVSKATSLEPMRRDNVTGIWSTNIAADLSGKYYQYLVDVFVPGLGFVRDRVTDPYSISLSADSKRSFIADLSAANLKPTDWDATPAPDKVLAQTDMVIYELHARDFSINDNSVPPAHRGKYLAFTDSDSRGMRHLRALSDAGLTDVHLLPVFDFATVPETGCTTPAVAGTPDGDTQQSAIASSAAIDCFNWGYDPYHFNAPEGSYASDAMDGATRIREFRQMVQGLHRAGLRVGMDVVYNHTTASGQKERSVLDRIVPGYYQRLDARGGVERSTCCDNTATENLMMGKLMIDSAVLWATQYRIDSFRFDLMGHQPRNVMETLRDQVNKASGREVNLIGEGWNFGEVADGARFVQASQLSLNGSGIGSFSDRARDAVRGGGPGDSGNDMLSQQGYINGLVFAPNAAAPPRPVSDLLRTADMVRVGLAGSIRDYQLATSTDEIKALEQLAYGEQPAGYASEPAEVVNYVENHDNQTLFDNNVYKLPLNTSSEDRARVQMLAAAINMFSQGVAYFHAGIDTLRSKSLDRNSFDSGDWFNRLDWTYRDNNFGVGLPPHQDNGKDYGEIRPLLANSTIKPSAADIGFARDQFRDLLRIRASTRLFRLPDATEIKRRLNFYNTGSEQNPVVIAGHLDGAALDGARFKELLYLVNVDLKPQTIDIPLVKGKPYTLHPVHLAPAAADKRPVAQARYEQAAGRFTVPARTALVYVVN
jgi:pullulanase/glycogen debranching enzyme